MGQSGNLNYAKSDYLSIKHDLNIVNWIYLLKPISDYSKWLTFDIKKQFNICTKLDIYITYSHTQCCKVQMDFYNMSKVYNYVRKQIYYHLIIDLYFTDT